MKLRFPHIFLFLVVLSFASFRDFTEPKAVKVLQQMNDSIKAIKTLRVSISALERVEKTFHTANSEIKLQTHPRRLYFKNSTKKIEILFNTGKLNNKALVKPNSFPYMALQLDPTGNLMRKNQHYTIHELGYEFVGKSIALTISKDKEGLNNFKYFGKVQKSGYMCHLIEYENKNYGYVDYVVGEKETVSYIASKLVVNDYLIRYKNNLLNDYGYVKKGKVLKVPNLFCKKATLYIDEQLLLPIAVSLSDDMGVFENYEFSKVQVNSPIKEEEFSKDYKDYKF
ncbi:MAG: hypothetical protein K0S32_4211 [Bacteroidetes bacterium]|jgi:hypothetical protein|nr:hypothetical protein [Bacteroidota bacterium]